MSKRKIFIALLLLLAISSTQCFDFDALYEDVKKEAKKYADMASEQFEGVSEYTKKLKSSMDDVGDLYSRTLDKMKGIKDQLAQKVSEQAPKVQKTFKDGAKSAADAFEQAKEIISSNYQEVQKSFSSNYETLKKKYEKVKDDLFDESGDSEVQIEQLFASFQQILKASAKSVEKNMKLDKQKAKQMSQIFQLNKKIKEMIEKANSFKKEIKPDDEIDISEIISLIENFDLFSDFTKKTDEDKDNYDQGFRSFQEQAFKILSEFIDDFAGEYEALNLKCIKKILVNQKIFQRIIKLNLEPTSALYEWNEILDELLEIALECTDDDDRTKEWFESVKMSEDAEEKVLFVREILKEYETLIGLTRIKSKLSPRYIISSLLREIFEDDINKKRKSVDDL